MFGQAIPRSFLWLVGLYAALTIGIIGCGGDDDENDWVGTWHLETIDGENYEQFLEEDGPEGANVSIVTNNWTFNSDGTIEVELTLEVEYAEGGSEISAKISQQGTGTYSLSDSNYTLTLTTEEGEETLFGGTDEDTGTWSRSGNTLTLNSDDGNTIVFKKQ